MSGIQLTVAILTRLESFDRFTAICRTTTTTTTTTTTAAAAAFATSLGSRKSGRLGEVAGQSNDPAQQALRVLHWRNCEQARVQGESTFCCRGQFLCIGCFVEFIAKKQGFYEFQCLGTVRVSTRASVGGSLGCSYTPRSVGGARAFSAVCKSATADFDRKKSQILCSSSVANLITSAGLIKLLSG